MHHSEKSYNKSDGSRANLPSVLSTLLVRQAGLNFLPLWLSILLACVKPI
jgi:hypothetical protein